jgi:hypothetical protein
MAFNTSRKTEVSERVHASDPDPMSIPQGDEIAQSHGGRDPRVSRSAAFAHSLKVHGYEPQVTGYEIWLPGSDGGQPLTIRCDHRDTDQGRLWHLTETGEPLAPADAEHLHEAITAVKGRVKPTGRGML